MKALALLAVLAAAAPAAKKAPGIPIHQGGVGAKSPPAVQGGALSPTRSHGGPADWATPDAATARASKSEVRLGELFDVTVDIKHAPGEHWVLDDRQKLDPFSLVSQSSTVSTEGTLEVTHLVLKMALFKLDANPIPDLQLAARDRAGQPHQLSLPGPTVKGVAPDLGKDHDKRDIHAPVPVTVKSYRLLWLALGILAAIGLAIWGLFWWQRRPQRAQAAPAAPPIPADEEAIAALAALEAEGLPAQSDFKEFHLRLSTIFRMYLTRRYGFAALDMTSAELLDELGRRSTEGLRLADISWICNEGDLAKFAKGQPTADACKEALSLVRQTVLRTRQTPSGAPPQPSGLAA